LEKEALIFAKINDLQNRTMTGFVWTNIRFKKMQLLFRKKAWRFKRIFVRECYNIMINTGGPRYMQSFYLRCVYAIEKWSFFWNLSSNLQSILVFLYANLLHASLFLEFLSIEYNEVHLYWGFDVRGQLMEVVRLPSQSRGYRVDSSKTR